MNETCGCGEGTFAYRVEATDVGETDAETWNNIANRFGIPLPISSVDYDVQNYDGDSLSDAQKELGYSNHRYDDVYNYGSVGPASELSHGDLVCIPNEYMPNGYTNPCEAILTEIDITMISNLQQLISEATVLGYAANANPDSVYTPHQNQLYNEFHYAEMGFAALKLVDLLGEEAMILAEDAIGDIPSIFGKVLNSLTNLNELVWNWLWQGYLRTDEAIALNNIYEPVDSDGDENKLATLLNRLIDLTNIENFEGDEQTRALRILAEARNLLSTHEQAVEADANFLSLFNDVRQKLEVWDSATEAQQLIELSSLIDQMKTQIESLNIWMGDIVQGFVNFHRTTSNRHILLSEMQANIDVIQRLMLKPEQRKLMDLFDEYGISYDCLYFASDEEFYSCMEQALSYALANAPDRTLARQLISDVISFDDPMDELTALANVDRGYNHGLTISSSGILANMQDIANTRPERHVTEEMLNALRRVFFVAGFIPVVGPFIDFASAIVAFIQGRQGDAALNLFFAMIDIDELMAIPRSMRVLTNMADDLTQRFGYEYIDEVRLRQVRQIFDELENKLALAERGIVQGQIFPHEYTQRNLQRVDLDNQVELHYGVGNVNDANRSQYIHDMFMQSSFSKDLAGFEQFMMTNEFWKRVEHYPIDYTQPFSMYIPYEFGAVFDGNSLVEIRFGTADLDEASPTQSVSGYTTVNRYTRFENMQGMTITHYHPAGTIFSRDDILTALVHGVGELRAVGVKYTFVFRPANYPNLVNDIMNISPLEVMRADAVRDIVDVIYERMYSDFFVANSLSITDTSRFNQIGAINPQSPVGDRVKNLSVNPNFGSGRSSSIPISFNGQSYDIHYDVQNTP